MDEWAIALRRSERSQAAIVCRFCGGSASYLDVARIAGVSSSTVAKWLRIENVRADMAARIRAVFHQVIG